MLLLFIPFIGIAQSTKAEKYANNISAEDIKSYLTVLTSDSLEGRETGRIGQKRAANFIANKFQSFGIDSLSGGYFQNFKINNIVPKNVSIKINGVELKYMSDYYHSFDFENDTISSNDARFVKNDFSNLEQKVVFVLLQKCTKEQMALLKNAKAKAIFFIDKNVEKNISTSNYYLQKERTLLDNKNIKNTPVFYLSIKAAKAIFHKTPKALKDKSYNVSVEMKLHIMTENLTGENVLGYVEGTDLKNELLVITAHYDHLGIHDGAIFYGADDDASGTSAVLMLAKAFAVAKKEGHGPRRSILFMPVSGEEKGLLGSSYYSENPVFPLDSTIADLNIDMIGRIDEKHAGNANYVYLIGSDKLSSELHVISDSANSKYCKIDLDYTFNDPNDPNRFYYRSDHYNFAKNNIPVIFYFNGVHADYHKATDTIDKIDFDKIANISKLVFYTAWELANRDKRIVVDKENEFKGTR